MPEQIHLIYGPGLLPFFFGCSMSPQSRAPAKQRLEELADLVVEAALDGAPQQQGVLAIRDPIRASQRSGVSDRNRPRSLWDAVSQQAFYI